MARQSESRESGASPGDKPVVTRIDASSHGHTHGDVISDAALESSARGIRALKISLLILGVTAVLQLVIVGVTGSVALLGDTVHNFADAGTAIPIWFAFIVGRRAANRRYTYGFGRMEDLAGAVVVLAIAASAIFTAFESARRLVDPQGLDRVGLVLVAGLIGFAGNELVAVYRIRVGRSIGSAALVADGYHARVDGMTSIAVVFGAAGVWAGYPIADPLVGLGIAGLILWVLRDSVLLLWHRLMDGVDPALLIMVEEEVGGVAGVNEVHDVRVRWLGHRMRAAFHVMVDEDLATRDSHRIAEDARHTLLHADDRFDDVLVHVDPCGHGQVDGRDAHAVGAEA